jgi:hypothetical protein
MRSVAHWVSLAEAGFQSSMKLRLKSVKDSTAATDIIVHLLKENFTSFEGGIKCLQIKVTV